MSYTRARIHRGTVTVECEAEVDIEEILRDISDAELRKECASRSILATEATAAQTVERREDWLQMMDDLRAAMRSGDGLHLEVLIIRMQAFASVPKLTILHPHEAA